MMKKAAPIVAFAVMLAVNYLVCRRVADVDNDGFLLGFVSCLCAMYVAYDVREMMR